MLKSLLSYSKYPAPGLFARNPASSLRYVSTYAPSLLLVLRANSSRRGVLEI